VRPEGFIQKKSNDPFGNRTRDLLFCSAVPLSVVYTRIFMLPHSIISAGDAALLNKCIFCVNLSHRASNEQMDVAVARSIYLLIPRLVPLSHLAKC
jgi:hypothetical protein